MKKILFTFVFLFVFISSYGQLPPPLYEYHIPQIQRDMEAVTELEKPRNYKNIASLNKVADYIKEELSKVCDSVSFQSFKVKRKEYKNVIGSIGVQHTERIIIGAHYDVFGDFEGADDNASGVVGLLDLARRLQRTKLKYRIDFVFYTLEEPPFFRTKNMGSYIHAKSLHDKNIPIKGMICLESIGFFSDQPNSQRYPVKDLAQIYGTKGDFVAVVQNEKKEVFSTEISNLMRKLNYVKTKPFVGSSSLPGVDFSDHLNYWKFGYPAVMITNTAFYRNEHYHTEKDLKETLDFLKLALVIKQLHKTLITLYSE